MIEPGHRDHLGQLLDLALVGKPLALGRLAQAVDDRLHHHALAGDAFFFLGAPSHTAGLERLAQLGQALGQRLGIAAVQVAERVEDAPLLDQLDAPGVGRLRLDQLGLDGHQALGRLVVVEQGGLADLVGECLGLGPEVRLTHAGLAALGPGGLEGALDGDPVFVGQVSVELLADRGQALVEKFIDGLLRRSRRRVFTQGRHGRVAADLGPDLGRQHLQNGVEFPQALQGLGEFEVALVVELALPAVGLGGVFRGQALGLGAGLGGLALLVVFVSDAFFQDPAALSCLAFGILAGPLVPIGLGLGVEFLKVRPLSLGDVDFLEPVDLGQGGRLVCLDTLEPAGRGFSGFLGQTGAAGRYPVEHFLGPLIHGQALARLAVHGRGQGSVYAGAADREEIGLVGPARLEGLRFPVTTRVGALRVKEPAAVVDYGFFLSGPGPSIRRETRYLACTGRSLGARIRSVG